MGEWIVQTAIAIGAKLDWHATGELVRSPDGLPYVFARHGPYIFAFRHDLPFKPLLCFKTGTCRVNSWGGLTPMGNNGTP